VTEGNVIYYDFIEKELETLAKKYDIKQVMYDTWGAIQIAQNLEGQDFEMIKFGQGYKSLSPPSKELHKIVSDGKLIHGGHPVLRWMFENVYVEMDAAANIKPSKKKSKDKIDGAVATIMALDGALRRNEYTSPYDTRGLLTIGPDGLEEFDHQTRMWKPYVNPKKKKEKPQGAIAYNTGGTPDYLKKRGEK